jgi:hypothetical protein
MEASRRRFGWYFGLPSLKPSALRAFGWVTCPGGAPASSGSGFLAMYHLTYPTLGVACECAPQIGALARP